MFPRDLLETLDLELGARNRQELCKRSLIRFISGSKGSEVLLKQLLVRHDGATHDPILSFTAPSEWPKPCVQGWP